MDTVLDFSISKTSRSVAPPPQTSPNAAVPFPSNLNLSNMNLSNLNLTALSSILMKSVGVNSLVAATAPQQQLHQTNLIKELSSLIGANFASESIHPALLNMNLPITNTSLYSGFPHQSADHHQNQQQAAAAIAATVLAAQTLSVNTPPPSLESTVGSSEILSFDATKNVLVKALSETSDAQLVNCSEFETKSTTKIAKPVAKRLKFSESFSLNSNLANGSTDKSNQSMLSDVNGLLNFETTPNSAANSLMNLHFGSLTNGNNGSLLSLPCTSPLLPPTPTHSSSIASSSVSSAQNSPISASLRRNSTASTSVNGVTSNCSKSSTPQRRPAAPIPEILKDTAYYERRKKNNDAAKRSRDSRRQKEELTAQRASILQQENAELRNEIDHLKNEINRLHSLINARSNDTAFNGTSAPITRQNFVTSGDSILHSMPSNAVKIENNIGDSSFTNQTQLSLLKSAFSPIFLSKGNPESFNLLQNNDDNLKSNGIDDKKVGNNCSISKMNDDLQQNAHTPQLQRILFPTAATATTTTTTTTTTNCDDVNNNKTLNGDVEANNNEAILTIPKVLLMTIPKQEIDADSLIKLELTMLDNENNSTVKKDNELEENVLM